MEDKDNKEPARKKVFIAELDEDALYAETPPSDEPPPEKVPSPPRPKTFHSKNFTDSDTQAELDKQKSLPHESELKSKLSRAEQSGAVISAVMLVYSFSAQDKPLFFLSMSLVTFLLRPLIGALFGKNNRAVQNALYSFSIVLFIGALIFLFI